jgi:hypothetical protein
MMHDHQKTAVRVAIVMPLGPNDDVTDTLASIQTYTTKSRMIIVVDDTGKPETAKTLQACGKDVHVVKAGDYPGGWGGLWVKLSQGFKYALKHATFGTLLRIDADALVIGPSAEEQACQYFTEHPDTGLIGSYKVNCNGDVRDFSPPARGLKSALGVKGLRRPAVRRTLREAVAAAQKHGYEFGEHCLGGAYFLSHACVQALQKNGWLDRPELAASNMGEDQLCALFTKACGYNLGDFATGSYPLGVQWKGLPQSPQSLLDNSKTIIHSVRFWKDMDEQTIRTFYAGLRNKKGAGNSQKIAKKRQPR